MPPNCYNTPDLLDLMHLTNGALVDLLTLLDACADKGL